MEHLVEQLCEVNDDLMAISELKGNRVYLYQLTKTRLYDKALVATTTIVPYEFFTRITLIQKKSSKISNMQRCYYS